MIKVNLSRISKDCLEIVDTLKEKVLAIDTMINEKTGKGSDFLGWTTYANELTNDDLNDIAKSAKHIQDTCDVLVVVGIGGSYLGAKAAIDAINGVVNKSKCEIVYLGNTLSPTYTAQVLKYIKGKKIGINVISKSGTTTEPAIAFRLVKEMAKECWGDDYAKYIIATTDKARGALFQMAINEGYKTFVIPDDVGGRYSVFTPVGLVPMAVAGLDIHAFILGAKEAIKEYSNSNLEENEAYKYAAIRYVEKIKEGKEVEFLVTYEPHLCALAEWWKQLFGESEGKEKKGLLPSSLCFTTDLHSMGQFCQEGTPCFFETTISLKSYQDDVVIPSSSEDHDKLNYLAGQPLSKVNDVAATSTLDAHYIDGGVNNVLLELCCMSEKSLGKLMFFFCKACAMSAYLLDVNPFNQPGVEIYKARMKDLLKKL